MKNIYTAPEIKVRRICPTTILAGSPGSGISTKKEEKNVVFESKGDDFFDSEGDDY